MSCQLVCKVNWECDDHIIKICFVAMADDDDGRQDGKKKKRKQKKKKKKKKKRDRDQYEEEVATLSGNDNNRYNINDIQRELGAVRRGLPVFQHKQELCDLISNNEVVLVVAETVRTTTTRTRCVFHMLVLGNPKISTFSLSVLFLHV